MKASEVQKAIEAHGGVFVREGKGSHKRFKCACGTCFTTVPNHKGKDLKLGLLKGIQKDLAACARFGERWLGV